MELRPLFDTSSNVSMDMHEVRYGNVLQGDYAQQVIDEIARRTEHIDIEWNPLRKAKLYDDFFRVFSSSTGIEVVLVDDIIRRKGLEVATLEEMDAIWNNNYLESEELFYTGFLVRYSQSAHQWVRNLQTDIQGRIGDFKAAYVDIRDLTFFIEKPQVRLKDDATIRVVELPEPSGDYPFGNEGEHTGWPISYEQGPRRFIFDYHSGVQPVTFNLSDGSIQSSYDVESRLTRHKVMVIKNPARMKPIIVEGIRGVLDEI